MVEKKLSESESEAARRLAGVVSPEAIDALLADAKSSGTPIDGAGGLLNQLTKAVLERALNEELTDHLGYEPGDPVGDGSGNSRNGYSAKTVATMTGPVRIDVPRDRNGEFEPGIVPKRSRRIGQIDQMILSLYSRGMTTRDSRDHLSEVYGVALTSAMLEV